MYSLIVTAKMNDIDPQAWLADVLARIASHPASQRHRSFFGDCMKPTVMQVAPVVMQRRTNDPIQDGATGIWIASLQGAAQSF